MGITGCEAEGQVAGQTIVEISRVKDEGGGNWSITRRYTPGHQPGAIDVKTSVSVDQNRRVIFLPMIGLFPGAGSFGPANIRHCSPGWSIWGMSLAAARRTSLGPASHRQVPDSIKITFPLMTVAAKGKYVGLIWEPRPEFRRCSIRRIVVRVGGTRDGGDFPGSDGLNRVEGSLLPDEGVW